jgi:hypothetical protein
MSINKLTNSFNDTLQKLLEVINAHLDYYQVVAFDKLVYLISKSVSAFILLGIGIMVTLFASLGLANFLGEILAHNWMGFLIVAAIYGFAGWIVWHNREKWIVDPIIQTLSDMVEDTADDLGIAPEDQNPQNTPDE